MKKIFLLLSLLCLVDKVNAKTYYSDYSSYLISDSKVFESDTVEVISYDTYEKYVDDIEYAYLEDSPYNKTGKVIQAYTNWTNDINKLDLSKQIEKYYEYDYCPARNYNYFYITNKSDKKIEMTSLKIYDYQNDKYIFWGSIEELLPNSGYMYRLTNQNNIANFNVEIEAKSLEENDSNIVIDISASFMFYDTEKELITKITGTNDNLYFKEDLNKYDIYPDISITTTEIFKEIPNSDNNYITYYRNVYDLYEYEIVNRKYLNEYSIDTLDNVDLDRVKTMYQYRTRDKVVINDNIKSIDDSVIEYSTIPLDNINIEYQDNIVLINIPFVEDTIIYELENVDNNNYIDEINLLNEKLDITNYLVDKKNLEIKELIMENDNYVDNLVNDLNMCYTEKKLLSEEKIELEDEKDIKKSSFSYIYLIIAMIVLLTSSLIMSIKKNS